MRSFLFPFMLGLVISLSAQPTIGPWSFFQPGHSYLRFNYDLHPDIAIGLIAADGDLYDIDLAWVNFATLYTSDSITCEPAPNSYLFHTAYYDTANVQITIRDRDLGGTRTHLFLVTPEAVKYVGGQPNGTGQTGDDLVFQRYPNNVFETVLFPTIEYGTTWTEPIDGVFEDASGSDEHVLVGTSTTTADGAGSITLPDGTFLPHTLRLRTVRDYLDQNALFGDTQRQDTLYTWWVDSWDGALMTLPIGDYGMAHGYVSPLPFTLYTRLGEVQPVGISESTVAPLRFGPSPCNERLSVDGDVRTPFSVLDMSGRTVMQGVLDAGVIDVHTLAVGSYTLLLGSNASRRARFVVAR